MTSFQRLPSIYTLYPAGVCKIHVQRCHIKILSSYMWYTIYGVTTHHGHEAAHKWYTICAVATHHGHEATHMWYIALHFSFVNDGAADHKILLQLICSS